MLKLRAFWILIALVSFTIGLYDFVELKSAKQSGNVLQEARLRADAYTEMGFGLGCVIIYELATINAKLQAFNKNLKSSDRGYQARLFPKPKYKTHLKSIKTKNN